MHDDFAKGVERRFAMRDDVGSDKVLPLKEAVRRYIRPALMLHLGHAQMRPSAILCEMYRQFNGQRPQFTLVTVGAGANFALLVHGGMVKKIITAYCGDSYPTPGPNRILQRAFKEGGVEFEHWSILTIPLRLIAGAMGVGFLPTRSLLGSSMADDNRGAFTEMADPFSAGGRIGLVSPLNPDVSLIHGLMADKGGNTILLPPLMDNAYAALAAREGAVVTVERIVPTQVIREHAPLVRLPGYAVKSVSQVPFGGHPGGITNVGLPHEDGYAEDYEFLEEMRRASREPVEMDRWIKHWILDCGNHDDYLKRLGAERLLYLKGKVSSESWRAELNSLMDGLSESPPPNRIEWMIAAGSRVVAERVRQGGYETILAGIGTSNLAAWVAKMRLEEEGRNVDLMAEAGFYGYSPRPADPFIFNFRNIPTCKMLTDIFHTMGIFMGGSMSRCIGVIGAAQVDRRGNVNSTLIPEDRLLVGSGGANDIASSAGEVVVTALQSRSRFVEEVPYITSPGGRVRTVVSDLGVFEKLDGDKELTLTGCFPISGLDGKDELIRHIREECGWELKAASEVKVIHPPNDEELLLLRLYDPRGQFLGKERRE